MATPWKPVCRSGTHGIRHRAPEPDNVLSRCSETQRATPKRAAKPGPSQDSRASFAEKELDSDSSLGGLSWSLANTSLVARGGGAPAEAKPTPLRLQPKLHIGAVDDPLEHEAERIADEVTRTPDAMVSSNPLPSGLIVRRKCSCGGSCEKCQAEKNEPEAPILQRKASGGTGPEHGISSVAPVSVAQVLRTPGRPLDTATRNYFEPRFQFDFSRVRIHADAAAAASAREVSALAYTVGSHVVMGAGAPASDTAAGRRLLAHELTHVIQQRAEASGAGEVVRRHMDVPCPSANPISAMGKEVYLPANDAIAAAYMADHRSNEVLFGEHFSRTLPRGAKARWADQFLSEFLGIQKQLQPDIIDFTEHAIYEVKSNGYAAKGAVQIAGYYTIAEAIQIAHSGEEGIGEHWSSKSWFPPHVLPMPGDPNGSLVCTQLTTHVGPLDGVILYSVIEKPQRLRPPVQVPEPEPVREWREARERKARARKAREGGGESPGMPDLVPAFAREHPVLTGLIVIGLIVGAIIGVDELIALGAALAEIGAALWAFLSGASFANAGGRGGSDGGSKSGDAGTAGGAGSGKDTGAGGAQGTEGTAKTGEGTAKTAEGKTDKGTSKTGGDADKAVAQLMEALKRFADPKGDKISPEDAKKILGLGLEFLNKLQTADPNDPNATRLKDLSAGMIPKVREAIKKLENAGSQKNDEAGKGGKDQPAGSDETTSDSHKKKEPKSGTGSGKADDAPKSSQKPKGTSGAQGGAEQGAFGGTFQFQPKNFNPDKPPQPGTQVDLIGHVQIRGKRVELHRSAAYLSTEQVDKNTRVAYFDLDDTSSVTIDGEEIPLAKKVTVTMTRK
jgi:hypothetical protein